MNIRGKLIGLALLTLTPAIAIQALNEFELRKARQAELSASALRDAQFAAGEIEQIVASMKVLVQTVGYSDIVRNDDIKKCDAFVAAIKREAPHLSTIAIIGVDGQAFCATLPTLKTSVLDRSYFKEALASKGVVVGDYTFGRLVPVPILPVAAPFYDESGQPAGVVVATLSLEWLANYFRERRFSTETRTIAVTDRKGTILVRLPDHDRWVGKKLGEAYDR
jgi:C4-dicarboxylate-specific signal transduction histidine kinase